MEEKVGGRIGWRKKKEDRNWRMSGGARGRVTRAEMMADWIREISSVFLPNAHADEGRDEWARENGE